MTDAELKLYAISIWLEDTEITPEQKLILIRQLVGVYDA